MVWTIVSHPHPIVNEDYDIKIDSSVMEDDTCTHNLPFPMIEV